MRDIRSKKDERRYQRGALSPSQDDGAPIASAVLNTMPLLAAADMKLSLNFDDIFDKEIRQRDFVHGTGHCPLKDGKSASLPTGAR